MTTYEIPGLTVTCLMITALICLTAVLVAWYTVRNRVKFSQIILGLFCYLLVMLLESLFDQLGRGFGNQGALYAIYLILSVVLAREAVRFSATGLVLRKSFDSADAAIGFALGFAGAYLLICAVYYFNCYTAARAYREGIDAFVSSSGADADEALTLIASIAAQSGWQFLLTGLNRVFYLVREIALCVLLWYAMEEADVRWYGLVPALHIAAMVPDGLFQASILTNAYARDIASCVLSAGIAYLAARKYNAREDQVAHYRLEKLYARRRR